MSYNDEESIDAGLGVMSMAEDDDAEEAGLEDGPADPAENPMFQYEDEDPEDSYH